MSSNWDGVERRMEPGGMQELKDKVEKLERSVSCIRKASEEFQHTYGDLLRETLEAKALKSKLWAAAAEELVRKGVWAALALIATAVWAYIVHGGPR